MGKKLKPDDVDMNRRRFMHRAGAGMALLGMTAIIPAADAKVITKQKNIKKPAVKKIAGDLATASAGDVRGALQKEGSIAAEATRLPPPITRDHAIHHEIELEAREVEAELESGTRFKFMTWDGQVPGPMIRVRQGDSVSLTVKSAKQNSRPHSLDLHAVYAPSGGSDATIITPGQSKTIRFKCMYPGAFIYHCAVTNMDEHISRGMFGMILVEPYQGLPIVDREFYLGQHELYTKEPFASSGTIHFSNRKLTLEQPTYVLFNGAVKGYTAGRFGPLKAQVGETVRVFMVCGGPNLTSSFHAVGNVWSRCWPQGALANPPLSYVQTQPVAPGSCMVGEMNMRVPGKIKLVDHALSRVVRKGLLAEIEVSGPPQPDIFTSKPQ